MNQPPAQKNNIVFFSKTKSSQSDQVDATLAELKVLNPSQTPGANSQTYKKYYKVEEGLKQYVCRPKPHAQNATQIKGA